VHRRRVLLFAAALALVLVSSTGSARGREPTALPEGPGLAAKYPGDRGIAKAKGVLLAESFEKGGIEDLRRRWSEVKNPGGKVLALAGDVPEGASGKRALKVTATVGENTGGHLYSTYPETDTVFVRFYVKFLDEEFIHHFVTLGGYRPATRWPQGHAGEKPKGDERFTVGIEPHGRRGRVRAPGVWSFYTYWHEMKRSGDGRHWGNGLVPEDEPAVPRNRWQCVEVMVKLNSTPEKPDGELALWLDGKLVAHFVKGARRTKWTGMGFQLRKRGGEPFEGFRWRKDTGLKANFLSLSHYVTDRAMRRQGVGDPEGRVVRVLFDHVVVATRYVGPIRSRK
jgi:hypothetical protein